MSIEKTQWIRRLDFSLLTAWLWMSLILAIISFFLYGMDFRVYYAAARVLVAGGNPYDYSLISQALLEVTGEIGNNPYYYPPWFAWLFVPLTFLSFQAARALWMIFNVIVWSIGLWYLGKIIDWPAAGWRRYSLFTLATFSFAWITWRYEQAAILVFVILVAFILSFQKQSWTGAGVWLALLLFKPSLTLIVVAGICIWLLRNGHWRAILVLGLTLFVLTAISTLITPRWYQPILDGGYGQGLSVALDGPNKVIAQRINTTFVDWLRTFGIGPPLRTLLYGIVICIGVIVFIWSVYRSELLEVISILLLVSYALTPYVLQYDYPPLVIPLFWALSRCVSSTKALAVGLALTGFVFSVIFWQRNISWAYWIVIGLIALMIWAILQEHLRRADKKKLPLHGGSF